MSNIFVMICSVRNGRLVFAFAQRWIESLNTVMDDNKVLTLASNERIALTTEMRLIFEVGHLKSATPATVSRGTQTFLMIKPAIYIILYE